MKKVAIGLAVVLVAVRSPSRCRKLLHSSGSSAQPVPPAATTTSGATAAPTTGTPATRRRRLLAARRRLPSRARRARSSRTRSRRRRQAKSQLFSFSHFTAKDPFVQQVSSTSPTGSSTTASSGTSASTAPPAVGTASAGGPNTTPRKQARALAGTGTATISINGKVQTVHVGASFPSANPLFRLVSLTHGVARIGIASGSYASGAQTLSLATGRAVTLVDTADGIRYKLRLISVS